MHTPGPWTVEQTAEYERTVQPNVCKVHGSDLGNFAESNARLIAAAPELLNALEEAWSALTDLNQPENDDGALFEKIRAAIAKATGE